jgi:hypothetical protein
MNSRNGQVLILAVPGLLVLMAVAVFTVDVGRLFAAKAQLQNASDAAVMGACQVLVSERAAGAEEEEARAAAAEEGIALAHANSPGAHVDLQFGTFVDREFREVGPHRLARAVKVSVNRDGSAESGPLDLFFAPVVGMDEITVETHAVSGVRSNVLGIMIGLSPFAIHENDVRPPGNHIVIYDQKKFAPGAFGLLNIDGGPFSTPEVWDWILNGYDKEFVLDEDQGYTWVPGGTGFRSAIKRALREKLGKEMTVCVYDEVRGQGHNTEFRVISLARASPKRLLT